MGRGLTADMALRYRKPMPVRETVRYGSGGSFPVCPRCGSAIEREYQNYCDRCGQRLQWTGFCNARISGNL